MCFIGIFPSFNFLSKWRIRVGGSEKNVEKHTMFDMDGLIIQSFSCLKNILKCSRLQSILHVE